MAMYWLLPFIPVAVGLEFLAPDRHLIVFVASSLAILPLAEAMGRATEGLAEQLGEGVGGLLNATFGNAAELIIALAALRAYAFTHGRRLVVLDEVFNLEHQLGALQ